jgi:hypothetical protein
MDMMDAELQRRELWDDHHRAAGRHPCVSDDPIFEDMFEWLPTLKQSLKNAGLESRCRKVDGSLQVCLRCSQLVEMIFPDTHGKLLSGRSVLFPCIVQLETYDNAGWRFFLGKSFACTGTTVYPHALCVECGEEMKRERKLPNWEVYFDEDYVVRKKIRGDPKLLD